MSGRHIVGDDEAEGTRDIRVGASECPERAYFVPS
jgi:hypothetical protein